MTNVNTLDLTKLHAPLGAEICGLDLTAQLPEPTVGAILSAWYKHQVLVFRDQKLSPQQLVDFTAQLGEPGRP